MRENDFQRLRFSRHGLPPSAARRNGQAPERAAQVRGPRLSRSLTAPLAVRPRIQRGAVETERVVPEGGPRPGAGTEHVPARINREADAVGAEVGQLVEEELAREIGRHEIGEAVNHQQPQLAVERERLAQFADRFRLAPTRPQRHWPFTEPFNRL